MAIPIKASKIASVHPTAPSARNFPTVVNGVTMTTDGSAVNFALGMGQKKLKVGSGHLSARAGGRRSIGLGNQAGGHSGDGSKGKTISLLNKSYSWV